MTVHPMPPPNPLKKTAPKTPVVEVTRVDNDIVITVTRPPATVHPFPKKA